MLPLEETGAVEIRLCQDGHLQWRDSAALSTRKLSKQSILQLDGEKKGLSDVAGSARHTCREFLLA
jgi:hypothetical protein